MARRSSGGRSYRPAARSPPRQPAAPRAAPPAPARGGSKRSSLFGAIADGIGFGAGHAVADRAVDAVMGPRTIQHKPAPAPAPAPAAADACTLQNKAFHECLYSYMTDISKCQIYMDTWVACRRTHTSSM